MTMVHQKMWACCPNRQQEYKIETKVNASVDLDSPTVFCPDYVWQPFQFEIKQHQM